MPYGVGGAAAEGLRSGLELALQQRQQEQSRAEFAQQQALREDDERRKWAQEEDRYGRLVDQFRVDAIQKQIASLGAMSDTLAKSGQPVPEALLHQRAQLQTQWEDMNNTIAAGGRLGQPGAGTPATPSGTGMLPPPNVASAMSPSSAGPAAGAMPPVAGAPVGATPSVSATPPTVGTPAGGPLLVTGAPVGATPPIAAMGVGGVLGTPNPGIGPSTAPVGMPPPMNSGVGVGAVDSGPTTGTGISPIPGGAPPAATIAAPAASAVTPTQKLVADTDQNSQNLASRLETGQLDFSDVKPGDFALMVASATKRDPSQLDEVRQHLDDFHAGMATGNTGLTLQGLNGAFGPMLSQGVGGPGAYGGTITGKQIIGLDPAISANGQTFGDRVIPRLRVTTDQTGPDGQPMHYDAPLTQNRTALDPNDPVASVSMDDAFNHLGHLGNLVTLAQQPDVKAKLEAGADDPRIATYLEAYKNQIEAENPGAAKENQVQAYMANYQKRYGQPIDRDTAVDNLVQLGVLPWHPTKGAVGQSMDAAYQLVHDGQAPDVPTALRMLQQGGITKQPTKYSPGVGPAAGTGTGGGGIPTGPGGAPLSGSDFLAKLSPEDRQTVLTVANDPSLLANVSEAKGRREHIQNLVHQYNQSLVLGAGVPGVDANGNPVGGVKPQTVDWYATQSIMGDNSWQTGLGRGKVGQQLIAAVKDRIPTLAKQLGLDPQDVGTNKASYAALTHTLSNRTEYITAVNQLSGTLDRQAQLVESLLAKGGATEGGPLFNAPYNAVRNALGSVDAHNLDVALTGLAREHQRVLVSPLSNAQLAEGAQATGDRLANLNLTPSQIMGTIAVMRQETANAKAQGMQTLGDLQTQLRGLGRAPGTAPAAGGAPGLGGGPAPAGTGLTGGAPVRIQSDADYDALASGTPFIGPDGVPRRKP